MMASYAEQQQQQPPANEPTSTGMGNVARIVDRLSKDIPNLQKAAPIKPPKPNNNNNSRTALVRFSYVAQQEDELTMEEDDVIELIEDVEDGWARGRLRGDKEKMGLFPTNFVSFMSTPTTNTPTYSSTLSRVTEEPKKKQREDHQQHSSPSNGKIPVEKTSSNDSNSIPPAFKASIRKNGPSNNNNNNSNSNSNNNIMTSSAIGSAKATKEYAKVLYDYKAVNSDELDLKEGDLITITNRKCTDEGWCEGELNGKRGLFPENFVKISTPSAGPPPSSIMHTSGSTTAPPLLPAKPLKPAGLNATSFNKTETSSTAVSSNASPTTTTTTTAQTSTTTTSSSPTETAPTPATTTTPPSTIHRPLEERKSVVAGIQSKLFSGGRMPPHKPTYQPPSNLLTSSQPHSTTAGRSESDSAPTVQMRHSVVDPTKMMPSGVHFEDQQQIAMDNGEEARPLESLTKFRPKQSGKRPPSTVLRNSVKPVDTPPSTPPQTPTTANTPPSVLDTPPTVAVSTGSSTTSFPADLRASSQQASPNTAPTTNTNARAQEIHSIVKELNSLSASVSNAAPTKSTPSPQQTMGQKTSRNNSSGSTHSNLQTIGFTSDTEKTQEEPISRAEFEEFRSEVLRRLAKLEERILKFDSSTDPTDGQHF